jgi:hypothetical protein
VRPRAMRSATATPAFIEPLNGGARQFDDGRSADPTIGH